MEKAKVSLRALSDFSRGAEEISRTTGNLQKGLFTLEKGVKQIGSEIEKYEKLRQRCDQIKTELEGKHSRLVAKKAKLEREIAQLKVKIQMLKVEIATLAAEVASLFAGLPLSFGAYSQAKRALESAKAEKSAAEAKLAKCEADLAQTESDIQTVESLQAETGGKQGECQSSISCLGGEKSELNSISNTLNETTSGSQNSANHVIGNVKQSSDHISRYLDITISSVSYTPPAPVALRGCNNAEYAGRRYDFSTARNASGEECSKDQIQYLNEKYSDVYFSGVDSYGNTYPDFSKYSKYEYIAPPVTKENLASGSCLIGDSKTGSADFRKFRRAMEADGYSKQEIAELLSENTIHHCEDGQTMQLIPRELHQACEHNGGAERIRLMKAIEGDFSSPEEKKLQTTIESPLLLKGKKEYPTKTFYQAPDIGEFKPMMTEDISNLNDEETAEIIRNQKAFEGSILYLTQMGVDFNSLDKAGSREKQLGVLQNSGFDSKQANQILSIFNADFLSDSDGSHTPFYSTSPQTAGDSYEFQRFFENLRDGFETAKEVPFDLTPYAGKPCNFLGFDEKIENVRRETDVVRFENGMEIHEELKVGRVFGVKGKAKFRQELYGDDLRLQLYPNHMQEYRLRRNGENKNCLLDDKEQMKYLYIMNKRHPDRVKVYFNDVLLSLEELESIIGDE